MDRKVKCGVLGATGMVGREFLKILANHPWIEVVIIAASERSKGYKLSERIHFEDQKGLAENFLDMTIQSVWDIKQIASQVDFVFSALDMGKDEIIKLEEAYAKAEVVVVSNNSALRFASDVPMIVPEINADHLEVLPFQRQRLGTENGCIVVKPNCAAQAYMALFHAITQFGIKFDWISVSLMQAISGSGKHLKEVPEIQGNILSLPSEADKSVTEPQKIFGKIQNGKIVPAEYMEIIASSYRVPVEDGHTAHLHFKTEAFALNKKAIEQVFVNYNPLGKYNLPSSPYPVINYLGDDTYPNPKEHARNQKGMEFTAGGMRYTPESGHFKITGLIHNLVRGAAGGAVLTAELMIAKGIIKNRFD